MVIVKEKEIELPDRLYRTWHAMKRFPQGCTATEISQVTDRSRVYECTNLNTLFLLKICSKKRRDKKILFMLNVKDLTGEKKP